MNILTCDGRVGMEEFYTINYGRENTRSALQI